MKRTAFSRVSAIAAAAMLAAGSMSVVGCSAALSHPSSGSGTSESNKQDVSTKSNEQGIDTHWPDNENTSGVPRPTFSGDVFVINQGGLTSFTYSGISSDDAQTYLQELKDSGFTKVESDSNAFGTISYAARNANTGTHMSYSYTSTSGSLTLSLDRFGV